MTTSRIQISRAKGWRMPAGAVKVDRTTRWGNPFRVGIDAETPAQAARMFQLLLLAEGAFTAHVRGKAVRTTVADIKSELKGKTLACWCRVGSSCHGDVLVEIANAAAVSPE